MVVKWHLKVRWFKGANLRSFRKLRGPGRRYGGPKWVFWSHCLGLTLRFPNSYNWVLLVEKKKNFSVRFSLIHHFFIHPVWCMEGSQQCFGAIKGLNILFGKLKNPPPWLWEWSQDSAFLLKTFPQTYIYIYIFTSYRFLNVFLDFPF